jgi:putative NADH-flavin reductase
MERDASDQMGKNMRIAVIGASGWLGGEIAREAVSRGHQVTGIGRSPDRLQSLDGMDVRAFDATDASGLPAVIADHDVVVQAVTDRSTPDRSTIPKVTRALIAAAPEAGVSRLVVVGGGGSLLNEQGERLLDQPGFPEQYLAEAQAGAEALDLLRAAPANLDWTYLSPPPQNLAPGEKRGGYSVGGDDRPVVNSAGETAISSADLASALLDEIERPQFARRRFTVGYD